MKCTSNTMCLSNANGKRADLSALIRIMYVVRVPRAVVLYLIIKASRLVHEGVYSVVNDDKH